jgi:hypothetical protein
MKSIGDIYFDPCFFEDAASKTIGEPAIGDRVLEVISNRRQARGKLNSEGQIYLEKIISEIKNIFETTEVIARWDKYCGCSMCPCSPGYRIKINRDVRSLEKYRFSLYVNEVGVNNIKKLEEVFK